MLLAGLMCQQVFFFFFFSKRRDFFFGLEQTGCCVGDTKGSLWEVSKGGDVCPARVRASRELVNEFFLTATGQQLLMLQACSGSLSAVPQLSGVSSGVHEE